MLSTCFHRAYFKAEANDFCMLIIIVVIFSFCLMLWSLNESVNGMKRCHYELVQMVLDCCNHCHNSEASFHLGYDLLLQVHLDLKVKLFDIHQKKVVILQLNSD